MRFFQKPTPISPMKYLVCLSFLVAGPVLYGGAYCLMLKGRYVTYGENYTTGPEEPHYHFVGPDVLPYDHVAGKAVKALFVPANVIDKRIRPAEWRGPQSFANLVEQPVGSPTAGGASGNPK